MCRALKVLCVAEGEEALRSLKRAAVSADWELAPGATTREEAIQQLHGDRPHVVVVWGPFEDVVRVALDASPGIRVVADRAMPRATVVASLDEVRDAILGRSRSGPVT